MHCTAHNVQGSPEHKNVPLTSGVGGYFSMEGLPFLRTQNLISSTKHAMNLLVQK